MRIDKLLWHLRLTRTRGLAQALVATGDVRRNGTRVMRASQDVDRGDTLTVPLPGGVQVIEIVALPTRRGPASEARACYRALDGQAFRAIAPAHETPAPEGGPAQ